MRWSSCWPFLMTTRTTSGREPIGGWWRSPTPGVPVDRERLDGAVRSELAWLLPGLDPETVLRLSGRARRHGSIEGNAVYALCRLGFVDHPGTRQLVEALLDWQWPDGGWNCDRHRDAWRSSFHESAIPALALATYAGLTGDAAAQHAAERTAELLLEHRLFRSRTTGEPIHPSWTVLHGPAYWHYDILQGLRMLAAVDRLDDPRAVERARSRGAGSPAERRLRRPELDVPRPTRCRPVGATTRQPAPERDRHLGARRRWPARDQGPADRHLGAWSVHEKSLPVFPPAQSAVGLPGTPVEQAEGRRPATVTPSSEDLPSLLVGTHLVRGALRH